MREKCKIANKFCWHDASDISKLLISDISANNIDVPNRYWFWWLSRIIHYIYLHFERLMSVLSKHDYYLCCPSWTFWDAMFKTKNWIRDIKRLRACTWVRVPIVRRNLSGGITDHRGDSSIGNDYSTLQSRWRSSSLWRISNYIYSVWSI